MDFRHLVTKLIEERRKKGLKQDDISAKLGISRQLVSAWENGRADPDMAQIMAWAEAIGAPLSISIGEDGVPAPVMAPTLPVVVTKLAAVWDDLPPPMRTSIVEFLGQLEALLARRGGGR